MKIERYFALASGFLTGKYRNESDLSKSPRGQGVKKYLNEKGISILHALDEVAGQYQVKPAAIALAWLMAQPTITAPIASATTIEQLNDLIKATEIKLGKEDILKLQV